MKVLVINAGSSSLKYQLMDMSNEHVLAKGLCERIGVDGRISHKTADGVKVEYDVSFPTHKEAFMELVKVMSSGEGKVIDSMSEISAIGHRVLHGSEKYKVSTLSLIHISAENRSHTPSPVSMSRARFVPASR